MCLPCLALPCLALPAPLQLGRSFWLCALGAALAFVPGPPGDLEGRPAFEMPPSPSDRLLFIFYFFPPVSGRGKLLSTWPAWPPLCQVAATARASKLSSLPPEQMKPLWLIYLQMIFGGGRRLRHSPPSSGPAGLDLAASWCGIWKIGIPPTQFLPPPQYWILCLIFVCHGTPCWKPPFLPSNHTRVRCFGAAGAILGARSVWGSILQFLLTCGLGTQVCIGPCCFSLFFHIFIFKILGCFLPDFTELLLAWLGGVCRLSLCGWCFSELP